MRQTPGKASTPRTRLVELPGRGVTRVWECAGPPGAGTLVLIHGVTFTAELNWGKAFAPLSRHFRVVAIDLRGHGDGISADPRFRLEDCADDIAALAGTLGIGRFTTVGYSLGGMVAQLLYRRHPSLLSCWRKARCLQRTKHRPGERRAGWWSADVSGGLCSVKVRPSTRSRLSMAMVRTKSG